MNNHTPKKDINVNDLLVSEKLKNFSEKNREDNLEKIRKMMVESAIEQELKEDDMIKKEVKENNSGPVANNDGDNFFDF